MKINWNKFLIIVFSLIIIMVSFILYDFIEASDIRESGQFVILGEIEGEVYHKGSGFWIFPGWWSEVNENIVLEKGESIKTEEGYAELHFLSGAKVHIEENTEIKLVENKTGDLDIKRLEMEKGSLLINLYKNLRENFIFEIDTPSAIAGVRGTKFSVKVDEIKGTVVSVNEGEVEVSNEIEETIVKAGYRSQIIGENKPIEVEAFSREEEQKWKRYPEKLEKREEILEKVQELKAELDIEEKMNKGTNDKEIEDKKPDDSSANGSSEEEKKSPETPENAENQENSDEKPVDPPDKGNQN